MIPVKRRASVVLAAVLLIAAVQVPGSVPGATAESGMAARADTGAHVVRETRIDERTLDLEIESPSLGRTGMVRVLLPSGWDEQPDRTWPALWLLHGCCEQADYRSWTEFTDVEEFTEDKPVMVVLPTDGAAGMYTKWWNYGLWDTPDWETFHVTEVRQILERGYRAGQQRAVAGLSIGGFGAMHYAFRHPGMFGAAASYSGVLNTLARHVPGFIKGILVREGFYNWTMMWGGERLKRGLWESHNPYDNVEKLRGTALFVSCGNGDQGPLEEEPPFDLIEPSALASSKQFTTKLREHGIPVVTDYYGAGTHTWPYWERALHRSWPVLARGLGL